MYVHISKLHFFVFLLITRHLEGGDEKTRRGASFLTILRQ